MSARQSACADLAYQSIASACCSNLLRRRAIPTPGCAASTQHWPACRANAFCMGLTLWLGSLSNWLPSAGTTRGLAWRTPLCCRTAPARGTTRNLWLRRAVSWCSKSAHDPKAGVDRVRALSPRRLSDAPMWRADSRDGVLDPAADFECPHCGQFSFRDWKILCQKRSILRRQRPEKSGPPCQRFIITSLPSYKRGKQLQLNPPPLIEWQIQTPPRVSSEVDRKKDNTHMFTQHIDYSHRRRCCVDRLFLCFSVSCPRSDEALNMLWMSSVLILHMRGFRCAGLVKDRVAIH